MAEEMSRACAMGFAISLHSDIVVPYIDLYGSEGQKEKWLPKVMGVRPTRAVAQMIL